MNIKIAFLQILPGKNLDEKAEGVRDMCVFEAPGTPGVYVAELNLDSLRTHRSSDVMGDKYRRPGKYDVLSNRNLTGETIIHEPIEI